MDILWRGEIKHRRLFSKKILLFFVVLLAFSLVFVACSSQEEQTVETNYLSIATLYPEIIQIIVREGTGIEPSEDLTGKKVAVGAPGNGVEANAKQILANFNLNYDNIDEIE